MRKLILRSFLALGDCVVFTSAIKELHRAYPNRYLTDVRTPFPDVWLHNPDITPIADDDPEAEIIDVHYDVDKWESVHRSNQNQTHLITAYCQDLGNRLGVPLRPQELKGHVYMSRDEYQTMSLPHSLANVQKYWIVNAGGKNDCTIKIWPAENYQRVISYFSGRVQFVQIGSNEPGHIHPVLSGVVNLIGKTDVRQLIQTVHSSCGVLCGITALSHLAIATPLPTWQRRPRPAVIVAGGREPRTWYSYPTHRVLETVGSMSCCRDGGCWHSHTVPIKNDGTERLCEKVRGGHPACMTSIRAESVILEIERVLECQGVE